MSNNVKKIEEVINELNIEDKYIVKDNRFTTPVGLKAQILEIKISKVKS